MSLEKAERRLTFESASTFSIHDRGLLRPGMAADITIFDPETVRSLPEDTVTDLPAGGWRERELAEEIGVTIVNEEVLIEDGKHTGEFPGRVMLTKLTAECAENARLKPIPTESLSGLSDLCGNVRGF